jgi:hypothetical protein
MVRESNPGKAGMCTHCPEPVVWRGRFQDGRGKWHQVWSCDDHADELTSPRRLPPLG